MKHFVNEEQRGVYYREGCISGNDVSPPSLLVCGCVSAWVTGVIVVTMSLCITMSDGGQMNVSYDIF